MTTNDILTVIAIGVLIAAIALVFIAFILASIKRRQ